MALDPATHGPELIPPNLHMTTSNRPFVASTGMAASCRQHSNAPDLSSISALRVESPRLSVIPLAVVIRTPKQTFEEAGASLGLGIVMSLDDTGRDRPDCSGQRLPGSRP